ncbi:MAG: hypothetical protein IKH45_07665 [Neisseriaceae bacterium]|nr:hypothetical protein [Neisseriaceae bacterium]
MTDENPYAPPKSTYYMQPEQDYQPTKGQKIMRIILGTLCVPLLMTIIEIGVMIWVSFVVNYQLRFFITFMTIFIGLYIISIVPNVIFTWILEKYCPTIGKKIICAFIFSIIIAVTVGLIAIFLPDEHSFFAAMMGTFMAALPATIITALILNAHYKYDKRKYFQAA